MFEKLRSFFIPPKLTDEEIELSNYSGYASDKAYEDNAQKIALHDLRLQKDALQKSLILMHRSVMVSVVSVVVAVLAVITAVVIATHTPAPVVTVKMSNPTVSTSH